MDTHAIIAKPGKRVWREVEMVCPARFAELDKGYAQKEEADATKKHDARLFHSVTFSTNVLLYITKNPMRQEVHHWTQMRFFSCTVERYVF